MADLRASHSWMSFLPHGTDPEVEPNEKVSIVFKKLRVCRASPASLAKPERNSAKNEFLMFQT